ncbi:nucleotide pyrophosphohydrolase [Agrobacterium rhizogenes]|uniref:MazG-like family protein n=1 Tax=Rhizobium rhizogenes TaxID=359 RepID=UPI00157379E4|nr:MazG-like family protein [Rhizobium rhizogenes]NTG85888.1 nucleotide pyrophosphohydrolase [Rhizobium rhizogenes]
MNELTVGRIEFAPRSFGILPAAVEGDTSPRWSEPDGDNRTNFTNLRAANIARQKEWDGDNQIDLAYRGNELAGEVGEACNVIKKLERERRGIAGSRDTKEHLAEELADVIICVDLIAMAAGIDMDAAVRAKFNATSEKVGLRTRLVAA